MCIYGGIDNIPHYGYETNHVSPIGFYHKEAVHMGSSILVSRVNKDNSWFGFFRDSGHVLVLQAVYAADFMNCLPGSAACCKCIQHVDIMP